MSPTPRVAPTWHYFALFRLLQLSPSYGLAHDAATSGASPQSEPVEFQLVRETYELFGPVWEIPFWEWWRNRARFAFGIDDSPVVQFIPQSGEADLRSAKEVAESSHLLFAVRKGAGRKVVLAQLKQLLAEHGGDEVNRYNLIQDKTRRKTVNEAIRTVQAKAHFGAPLFVVGNRTAVADHLKTDDITGTPYTDERRIMAILVHRHLKRGHALSENAARGRFPSFAPPAAGTKWPKLDYERLKPLLDRYAEVSSAALDAIPEDQRKGEHRYAGRNLTIRWK